ncbi:hypothetical protein Taro_056478 [Colocasia esculenta]|uniref:Uncharacterized protein n=1 Tax=Colocasia esculenta TaxID=4460 RepID=A0A843XTZ6_COLES|nr:hypothetical protein [Colocasia esculenta]
MHVGETLSAKNKDSFLLARQKGPYLTCLDVSRKYRSKARRRRVDEEEDEQMARRVPTDLFNGSVQAAP